MMIDFTPTQKRTVALGLTVLALAVTLSFVAFIGWGGYRFLQFVSPALTPVILGLFLALLFKPYYGWWLKYVKNPTLAALCLSISVLVPAIVLVWFGGAFAADQVSHLSRSLPQLAVKASAFATERFPKLQGSLAGFGVPNEWLVFFTDPAKFMQELISQFSSVWGTTALKAGARMLNFFSSIGTVLLSLLFFYYFLMRPNVEGTDCAKRLPFLKPETQEFVAEEINQFRDIVVSFFQRQVVICLIEGCLYGVGFALVGLPYGFLIGFMLGALNLVPLFGTIMCMPLALPLAYFGDGGSFWVLIGVLCVWLTGQVLDGYLITPKIQGEKTGLGYAGVIFSFLFWGVVFRSMLGLLLAIPLSAFCVVFWRAFRTRYVRGVI